MTPVKRALIVACLVAFTICTGMAVNSASAFFRVTLTGEAACVEGKPVAELTLRGDDEHAGVVADGPFVGGLPVNSVHRVTVPLEPDVASTFVVKVRRDGGGGHVDTVSVTVTGRTDCAPEPSPSPTPTPTPSPTVTPTPTPTPTVTPHPTKPPKGKPVCQKRTCPRDPPQKAHKRDKTIGTPVHTAPAAPVKVCEPTLDSCLPNVGNPFTVSRVVLACLALVAGLVLMVVSMGRKS